MAPKPGRQRRTTSSRSNADCNYSAVSTACPTTSPNRSFVIHWETVMPEPEGRELPDLVIDQIARVLTEQVNRHEPGHCVRVDNLRLTDAYNLARALRDGPAGDHAYVHVLADTTSGPVGDGLLIPAEGAVELRNRK